MFEDRYEISGKVIGVSPLHVGTGETRRYRHVKGSDAPGGNQERPEVAAIVRDGNGDPIIPSSTFKGLLRAIGEKVCPDEVSALFGEIKGPYNGRMGLVLPRTVVANELPDARAMPYGDDDARDEDGNALGHGVFIAARTSIDATTGATAKNKLFFQEAIAAGAQFEFKLVLLGGEVPRLLALLRCLACLLDEHGMPIGGESRTGGGRIRLRNNALKIVSRKLDDNGNLNDEIETERFWTKAIKKARLPNHAVTLALDLVCDGPFVIADSSWNPKAEKTGADGAEESKRLQLVGQRDAAGAPLVLGESVMGALRARARWLWALERLKGGATDAEIARIDCSAFGESRIVRDAAQVDDLSSVERVFGVTGFKGLLELVAIEVSGNPTEVDLTSVKLDRFSGAPFDQALFTTNAFLGVCLALRFGLSGRDAISLNADDSRLACLLFQDIRENGLMLGHGGNKGFGWFRMRT